MQKILISACFLGCNVRYNAKVKSLSHSLIQTWHQQGRLLPFCPEVAGGLSVPRSPAELNLKTSRVINSDGADVTCEFELGAKQALDLCIKHNIRFALLKESSPSCGSKFIYDGSFTGNKITGQGVTTQLLRLHDIKVFSELTITQLAKAISEL